MKVIILVLALAVVAHCRPQYEASVSSTPIPILSFSNELTPEGGYSYSYQSADGSFREEYATPVKVDAENITYEIRGSYSYISPDGVPVKVVYTSGRDGFKAEGAHLPTPPTPLEPSYYYDAKQGFTQKQYNQAQASSQFLSSRNTNVGSVFESHKTSASDLKTASAGAYNSAQTGFSNAAYNSNVNNVASNTPFAAANSGAYKAQQDYSGLNAYKTDNVNTGIVYNTGAYNSEAYKTAAVNSAASNIGAYKSGSSNTGAYNTAYNTGAYNEAYKTATVNTAASNSAHNTGAYNEAYKTAAVNTAAASTAASNLAYNAGAYKTDAANSGAYSDAYKSAAVNTAAYNTGASNTAYNTGAYNEAYKSAAVNTAAASTAASNLAYNAGAYKTDAANSGAYSDAYKSTAVNTGAYNAAYKSGAVNTAASNLASYNTGAYSDGYKSAAVNTAASNTAAYNTGAYNEAYKSSLNNQASSVNAGAYKSASAFNQQNNAVANAAQTSSFIQSHSNTEAQKLGSETQQQNYGRSTVVGGSVVNDAKVLGANSGSAYSSVSFSDAKSAGTGNAFKSEVVHQTGSQLGGAFKTEVFTPDVKSLVQVDNTGRANAEVVKTGFSASSGSSGSQTSSVSNQAAFNVQNVVANDQSVGQVAQQYPGAPAVPFSPIYSIYYKDYNPNAAMQYSSYPVYNMQPPVQVLPPAVYPYDHNKV